MPHLILLPAVLLAILSGATAPAARAAPAAAGPLFDYVAKPDASYRWVERRAGRLGDGASYVELTLTSQTWRGIPWRHQLFLIRPPNAAGDTRHALLFLGAGVWRSEYEGSPPPAGDAAAPLPAEVEPFGRIAGLLRTPVAVLRQVPFQPLFDGLAEDALIAFTFENYLRTGDPEWPLLLPMVKSAVRAMDAAQDYARREWSLEVATFTVAGASKRGWTVWLTAAVDDRVTAVAPMVIDMLNLGPQVRHQQATWGGLSPMLRDYTGRELHQYLETEAGQALLAIVDPYGYRDRLTGPKLIVLGTNDPYWPLDALDLYWNGLPGEKYVLYMPNAGHGLGADERLIGSLNALHQHAATGAPLPDLRWRFDQTGAALTLRVESDPAPREVVAWVAASPTRDFRQARWESFEVQGNGGAYAFALPIPQTGYAALFGEAAYDDDVPYFLSTNIRIVGAE